MRTETGIGSADAVVCLLARLVSFVFQPFKLLLKLAIIAYSSAAFRGFSKFRKFIEFLPVFVHSHL